VQAKTNLVRDPWEALAKCSDEIRQGSFTPQLLQRVEEHEVLWRQAQNPLRFRAAIVTAEVFDYFGRYQQVRRSLERFNYELRDVLAALKSEASRGEPVDLIPRMWVVLCLTQALYREDDFPRTAVVMRQCLEILDKFDPNENRFLGTRARILMMIGQSLRQTSDYEEAIRSFTESIRFANARFIQKTPGLELEGPDGVVRGDGRIDTAQFLAAQRLAHWSTAKSLALGMGWIRYVTGRLASATNCLSTGSTLLRALHDPIHRAYCQLLIAAVARAKDAQDPEKVRKTLAPMRDAAAGLAKHPLFSVRAHYELAVAYLHFGDHNAARAQIDELSKGLEQPDAAPFTRWRCAAQILESRLMRKQGDLVTAADTAKKALDLAQEQRRPNWEIEALIAQGEALGLCRENGMLDQAVRCMEQARAQSKNNPKTEAVCTLHLAQFHFRLRHEDRARDELNRWKVEYESAVEHGFVRHLARSIERQLGYPDPNSVFVIQGDRLDENLARLEKAVVTRVLSLGLDRAAEKQRLGLKTERQVQRLQDKHRLGRAPATKKHKPPK
jgi:tetratricopeptide (TPR) repeat protein